MVKYLYTVIISSLFVLGLYLITQGTFLKFSDAAKFAGVAKNITLGLGYTSNFSNFVSKSVNSETISDVSRWIPPLMPLSIASFFKLFGISDLSVIMTSAFFFLLTVICVYLLGSKLFSNLVGFLAAVALIVNVNFLDYATSGASETLFTLEIVFAFYLLILKKGWANVITALVVVAMFYTRVQAVIYIFALTFLYFVLSYKTKKALVNSFLILLIGFLLYISLSKQGIFAITQNLPGVSSSDSLRGLVVDAQVSDVVKKVFYNLYNFYKLMPQIMNPYLWGLFVIGLLRWHKEKTLSSVKISVVFMVFTTFLTTAATIPMFRYIHPIVPFIYLFAVELAVWIVGKMISELLLVIGGAMKSQIANYRSMITVFSSSVLILIFCVGQTLGIILLDSRFERNTHNIGKPPVYVELSWLLRKNTDPGIVVVTNLDTWGSWYGERKTVWFPLEPKQLIDQSGNIPFDAIYLTSYLIDDENYYMGESWRKIFLNPSNPEMWDCEGCSQIAREFYLKGGYNLKAFGNYQNEDATAVLLLKR